MEYFPVSRAPKGSMLANTKNRSIEFMKYLIFDIGGVIVYPRLGQWNIPFGATSILGSRANDIGSEAYNKAYQKAVVYLDESQFVPDTDAEYILRKKFISSLNLDMQWHMTENEISALTRDFTFNINRYGFFEDVKPWLEKWKKRYSMGLLSDALPSILLFMDEYGISDYFDSRVISAHVGSTKPNRNMYESIIKKLGAQPEDCVFVDDRVCNLEGAIADGIHAVQMARNEFMPDTIWDGPVVHNFEELDYLLESGELF